MFFNGPLWGFADSQWLCRLLDGGPADGLIVFALFCAKLVHQHRRFSEAHASLHRDVYDLCLWHLAVQFGDTPKVIATRVIFFVVELTLGHFFEHLARLVPRAHGDANMPHDRVENAAAAVPLGSPEVTRSDE